MAFTRDEQIEINGIVRTWISEHAQDDIFTFRDLSTRLRNFTNPASAAKTIGTKISNVVSSGDNRLGIEYAAMIEQPSIVGNRLDYRNLETYPMRAMPRSEKVYRRSASDVGDLYENPDQ